MGLYRDVLENREQILLIAKAHGVCQIRIFGSVVRGEDTPESDLDFLVEFLPGKTLLDQVALVQDLEELFGRRVDVVTEGGLHWYIKDRVQKEAVSL
ncbi:MAG: nucleotidyltransferase family protein [Methanomicrobiales archaeon]|nr:nucleotidyltransferase family protein [Methanomicrobiales archaeon]